MNVRWIPLRGGLGNQIFQFCAGELLARHGYNVRFVRPRSWAQGYRREDYSELFRHLSEADFVVESKLLPLVSARVAISDQMANLTLISRANSLSASVGPSVEALLFQAKRAKVMPGYFQNEELVEASDCLGKITDFLREEQRPISVVHFRGGDFLTGPAVALYGRLSASYYLQSLGLQSSGGSVELISDDPESFAAITNGKLAFNFSQHSEVLDDVKRAISAQHFIGANSTLSWWIARIRAELGRPSTLPLPFYPKLSPLHGILESTRPEISRTLAGYGV